jgi:hypothetical protein
VPALSFVLLSGLFRQLQLLQVSWKGESFLTPPCQKLPIGRPTTSSSFVSPCSSLQVTKGVQSQMLLLINTQQCYYQMKIKQDMKFGFGIHELK